MTLLAHKYDTNPAIGGKGNIHPLVITHVYNNTLDTSPLRRVLTDITVWGMELDTFSKHRTAFPNEFLADYILQQGRRSTGQVPAMQLPLLVLPQQYFVTAEELPRETLRDRRERWRDHLERWSPPVEEPKQYVEPVTAEKNRDGEGPPIPIRPKKVPKGVRAASVQ
jgi:hypothetical protein